MAGWGSVARQTSSRKAWGNPSPMSSRPWLIFFAPTAAATAAGAIPAATANGRSPVSDSCRHCPNEYTSMACGSARSPRKISGGRYENVPMWPAAVSASHDWAMAIPKSTSFTPPPGLRMMFAGLTSRWKIPAACACSRAEARGANADSASGSDSLPRWRRALSVSPCASSMAR